MEWHLSEMFNDKKTQQNFQALISPLIPGLLITWVGVSLLYLRGPFSALSKYAKTFLLLSLLDKLNLCI